MLRWYLHWRRSYEADFIKLGSQRGRIKGGDLSYPCKCIDPSVLAVPSLFCSFMNHEAYYLLGYLVLLFSFSIRTWMGVDGYRYTGRKTKLVWPREQVREKKEETGKRQSNG